MYTWQMVGHGPAKGPLCAGIGDDLTPIMQLIEGYLARDADFVGYIVEAVQRLSVGQLEPVHVPTGREWVGRRDRNGGCFWQACFRPPGSDALYPMSTVPASAGGNPDWPAAAPDAGR